jgi:hypothetical protein
VSNTNACPSCGRPLRPRDVKCPNCAPRDKPPGRAAVERAVERNREESLDALADMVQWQSYSRGRGR